MNGFKETYFEHSIKGVGIGTTKSPFATSHAVSHAVAPTTTTAAPVDTEPGFNTAESHKYGPPDYYDTTITTNTNTAEGENSPENFEKYPDSLPY